MRYFSIAFALITLLLSTTAFSQADSLKLDPIAADRPDQTETPAIVPKGMFQFETGLLYEKTTLNTEQYLLPTLLSKYGVNEFFELRLITEVQSNNDNGVVTAGLAPVLAGFKVRISQEKGIIPATSFIGHVQFPKVASHDFAASHLAPEFRFVMQHTLNEKMSFSYNLGAEWDGETAEATYIYTVSTGIGLSNKLGMYFEFFGFAPELHTAAHSFDSGFTYLLSNDAMLDISGGIGLNDIAPDYFLAVGFSFRI